MKTPDPEKKVNPKTKINKKSTIALLSIHPNPSTRKTTKPKSTYKKPLTFYPIDLTSSPTKLSILPVTSSTYPHLCIKLSNKISQSPKQTNFIIRKISAPTRWARVLWSKNSPNLTSEGKVFKILPQKVLLLKIKMNLRK